MLPDCRKSRTRRALGLLLLAVVFTSEPARPAANQDTLPTLTGRVIDADSGEPIAGARIVLTRRQVGPVAREVLAARLEQGPQQPILTAADGSFRLNDVAPGSFSLRAIKPGYLGGYFGQAVPSPDDTIQSFDLKAGEHVSRIILRLWKPGSVRGRVLSTDGEPIPNRWVAALRVDVSGPRIELRATPGAVLSDQHGDYRLTVWSPADTSYKPRPLNRRHEPLIYSA